MERQIPSPSSLSGLFWSRQCPQMKSLLFLLAILSLQQQIMAVAATIESDSASTSNIPYLQQTKPRQHYAAPIHNKFLATEPKPNNRNSSRRTAAAATTAATTTRGQEEKMHPMKTRQTHRRGSLRGMEIKRTLKHKSRGPKLGSEDYQQNHHQRLHTFGPAAVAEIEFKNMQQDNPLVKGGAKVSKVSKETYDRSHNIYPATFHPEPLLPKNIKVNDKSSSGKSSSGKSKRSIKGSDGKSGKGKSGKKSKRGKKGKKGVQSFETNLLLETKNKPTLDYDQLRQLEFSVMEILNEISVKNCDLKGRELVSVTADPTPTQTGYIFHLQGECYDCDPYQIPLFGSSDESYFDVTNESKSKNTKEPKGATPAQTTAPIVSTNTTPPSSSPILPNVTASPGINNETGNATTVTPTQVEFVPPGARNRGPDGLLQKKPRTYSKQRSRLRASDSQDGETHKYMSPTSSPYLSTGTWTHVGRPDDYETEIHDPQWGGTWTLVSRNGPTGQRRLQEDEDDDLSIDHGPNVNRGPDPKAAKKATDRKEYGVAYYNADDDYDPSVINLVDGKSKGTSGSTKSSKVKGFHPRVNCLNQNATYRAPTQAEFVIALNYAAGSFLENNPMANPLAISSATQVEVVACPAVEEIFDSALVIQFMGQATPEMSVGLEEIALVEDSIMKAYNHLQATSSCDAPQFREMREIVFQGIAQSQTPNTFFGMFQVRATCRGAGCSTTARLFESIEQEQRFLEDHLLSGGSYNSYITQAHPDDISNARLLLHQKKCYCPYKIQEYGAPSTEEMQVLLTDIIEEAYAEGRLASIVSVVDITEMAPETSPISTGFDQTTAPSSVPSGAERVDSFIIVQFFGQRDFVREDEVDAIEASMPQVYQSLQERSFCDREERRITLVELSTVDPGPSEDSFLLGFVLTGFCQGIGCSANPMFFQSAVEISVPCGDNQIEGPPLLDDFENDLFEAILGLRDDGTVQNIQASGDAVEILMDSTPAPVLSVGTATTMAPSIAPATIAPTSTTASRQGRKKIMFSPTEAPIPYPTWLETDLPTFIIRYYKGNWNGDWDQDSSP